MVPGIESLCNAMQTRVCAAYHNIVILADRRRIKVPSSIGKYPTPLDDHIAKLCGYKDGEDMAINYRDETDHTLKLLGDPSTCFIIYKTLEARLK